MGNLLDNPVSRMRSELHTLDGAFLRIASWLLTHDDSSGGLATLSTGALANTLGTSRATIVRFCQHLGYRGFPDFKAAWTGMATLHTPLSPPVPELPPAVEKIYALTQKALETTLITLDMVQFTAAVQAVANASTVILYGVGDSAHLAASGAHKLAMAAKPSFVASSTPSLRVHEQTISQGDVVILVSQSGRWENVLHTLAPFRANGCLVVAITSQAHSPMAQFADFLLLTATSDITLGNHPFTLRAAQGMVLDMLVITVASQLGKVDLTWEHPRVLQDAGAKSPVEAIKQEAEFQRSRT